MKVSKGKTQPELGAAAFLVPYMVLGYSFVYRVLIMTHLCFVDYIVTAKSCLPKDADGFL